MIFNKLGILLTFCMAMAVVGMLGAAAAQAEANKGPLWIVGSPAKGLAVGETRAITARSEAAPIFRGTAASIECEKATGTGFLLGGSPGTGYGKTTFEKCNLVGKRNCIATGLKPIAATRPGELILDVLTELAFATGSRTSAVGVAAPVGEAANEDLLAEFELLNKEGATEELCGAVLNKIKIRVTATGTEIKIKGEARKVDQIAEGGHLVEGKFVLSTPGLTSTVGLLRLGDEGKPVKTAELYNKTTEKYEEIKAEMSAGVLGEVFSEGSAEVETVPAEPFGWSY
jgi:hypothetical protein